MQFTETDHQRVATAIAAAEANTSGEVFCVVAREVSAYHAVSLGWAAFAALVAPLALIPLGFDGSALPSLSSLAHLNDQGWQAAHPLSQGADISHALTAYALVQALVFALVYGLTRIPAITRLVTPRRVRRTRVRKVALQQFLSHGLHTTQNRTGVLIFAALSDHWVEVIADKSIHDKVDPEVWGDAVAALIKHLKQDHPVEGLEQAISICGGVLAEHFPPSADDQNELPDRLVVI